MDAGKHVYLRQAHRRGCARLPDHRGRAGSAPRRRSSVSSSISRRAPMPPIKRPSSVCKDGDDRQTGVRRGHLHLRPDLGRHGDVPEANPNNPETNCAPGASAASSPATSSPSRTSTRWTWRAGSSAPIRSRRGTRWRGARTGRHLLGPFLGHLLVPERRPAQLQLQAVRPGWDDICCRMYGIEGHDRHPLLRRRQRQVQRGRLQRREEWPTSTPKAR